MVTKYTDLVLLQIFADELHAQAYLGTRTESYVYSIQGNIVLVNLKRFKVFNELRLRRIQAAYDFAENTKLFLTLPRT